LRLVFTGFCFDGSNIYYETGAFPAKPLRGPFDNVDDFCGAFMAHCLTGIVSLNEFSQATRCLKTMGFVP
jgi:hypothetical protein